jgi:hypothetical protein
MRIYVRRERFRGLEGAVAVLHVREAEWVTVVGDVISHSLRAADSTRRCERSIWKL